MALQTCPYKLDIHIAHGQDVASQAPSSVIMKFLLGSLSSLVALAVSISNPLPGSSASLYHF